MNIFHNVLELWLGHESGTDRRTDGQTYVTDRGNTYCPSAILRIGGGIKIQYLILEISLRLRIFPSNFMKNTYFFALGRGPYMGPNK